MPVTLWIRANDIESADAQRFLKANKYGADQVRDVASLPPAGAEWAALGKGLGGDLWPLVDVRHPRYGECLPRGVEDMDDAGLQAVLERHPEIIRTPVLLTPKGAVAGFRERKWRDFLDIGKGRN